eukprot:GHVS01015134.1.p1 GENE.GHVS01015134.1~~GHVS01015134.1.p1  ORF type:complete len:172 (-),score=14.51 GHVS01015134.1:64-579(-)
MASATQAKVFRWALALSHYNLHIKHISGATNKVADLLSRLVAASPDEGEPEEYLVPPMPTLSDFQAGEAEIPAEEKKWLHAGRIREAVIFYHHSGRFGGHQGINRTAARLRASVWWLDHRRVLQTPVALVVLCDSRPLLPFPRHKSFRYEANTSTSFDHPTDALDPDLRSP